MLNAHTSAVWVARFSRCGRMLATAGQDRIVRVWLERRNAASLVQGHPELASKTKENVPPPADDLFFPSPIAALAGHDHPILDLCWSAKSSFLLSFAMDKTVRFWHYTRKECLAVYLHQDLVSAIAAHPTEDHLFVSCTMDGRVRLWDARHKSEISQNKVPVVDSAFVCVTAAAFSPDGKRVVVGTNEGLLLFYDVSDDLKYEKQIMVKEGAKISGIEPFPHNALPSEIADMRNLILVTSSDARIRLYAVNTLMMLCKYRGSPSSDYQLRATFTCDGKYVLCGAEDRRVYAWETSPPEPSPPRAGWRRDRNETYYSVVAHSATVTTVASSPLLPNLIVTAAFDGTISIFVIEPSAQ